MNDTGWTALAVIVLCLCATCCTVSAGRNELARQEFEITHHCVKTGWTEKLVCQ